MLSSQTLIRLTDYVVALHEAKSFEQISDTVRAGLEDLVPVDSLNLGFSLRTPSPSNLSVNQPAGILEQFNRKAQPFLQEDPVYTGRLRLILDGAAPIHRFMDTRTLAKTNLYNEAWRPFGFKHMLRHANPGKYSLGFVLARSLDAPFTDEEVSTLDVLGKQTDQSIGKLIGRHHGKLPVTGQSIAVDINSWLVCDRTGAIIRTTPESLEHLQACLGASASLDRVPPAWHRVYLSRVSGGGPEPREYRINSRSITVHVAPIKGSPGEFSVFFVERILEADPLESLLSLGLTNREAEVMKWMIEGKTNPEIGVIMGITPLTAKKHVENIRGKLNAPNRTAAVAMAMERTAQT